MFRYRLAVLLGVVLALAGCGSSGEGTFAPARVPSASSSPSASPSVAPTTSSAAPAPSLSRAKACQQAVEGATDWVYLVSRFVDDPAMGAITADEIDRLIDKLRGTVSSLDDATAGQVMELIYPLESIRTARVTGDDRTVDLEGGREAVLQVLKGCRGKADLSGYKSDWDR